MLFDGCMNNWANTILTRLVSLTSLYFTLFVFGFVYSGFVLYSKSNHFF